jgi:peptidoglycan/LPS O-acetylase OafA/YrhL
VFQSHAYLLFGDFGSVTFSQNYKILESLGALGVTAFFFLSGFLITTLLRNEYTVTGGISIRNFYLRRIYRLAPVFYLVLICVFLLSYAGYFSSAMTWVQLLAQALQATNYYLILINDVAFRAQGTGTMWSLAVEEHFYLIYPLIFLPLLARFSFARITLILLAICLMILIWRFVGFFGLGFSSTWLTYATDSRADSILAGCLMGVWRNPSIDGCAIRNSVTGQAVVIACCGIAVLIPLIDLAGIQYVLSYTIQSLCLFVIFTHAILRPEWWCFRWLNWSPFVALGTVSYCFYLCHLPIMKLILHNAEMAGTQATVVAFLLTVIFSAATYWGIERHMARLRRRLHRDTAG